VAEAAEERDLREVLLVFEELEGYREGLEPEQALDPPNRLLPVTGRIHLLVLGWRTVL
jgi:hypothetical protein